MVILKWKSHVLLLSRGKSPLIFKLQHLKSVFVSLPGAAARAGPEPLSAREPKLGVCPPQPGPWAPRGVGLLSASNGVFCHLFWVRREGGEASGGRGAAAGRPQPSPSNSARLGAVLLQLSPLGPAPISRNVCASVQNALLSMACASSDETDFSPCQLSKASSSDAQPGGGRAEGRGWWREGARPVSDLRRRPRHLVLLSRAFSWRSGCSVGAEQEDFAPIVFQEFGCNFFCMDIT